MEWIPRGGRASLSNPRSFQETQPWIHGDECIIWLWHHWCPGDYPDNGSWPQGASMATTPVDQGSVRGADGHTFVLIDIPLITDPRPPGETYFTRHLYVKRYFITSICVKTHLWHLDTKTKYAYIQNNIQYGYYKNSIYL